jgi:hypothetical protein
MTPGGRGDESYRESMLTTRDIPGAGPGTRGRFGAGRCTMRTPREVKDTMRVRDIEGTRPRGHFTLLPGSLLPY